MFKKTLLTLAVIGALSACDSDNNDDTNSVSASKTITVIDGYLINANVYADRNANGQSESGELIGKTNDSGQITIPAADAGYDMIVTVEAGVTSDSDKPGFITQNYVMHAGNASEVVTPFTTLAKARNISVADVAAELNIDASIISGDYIKSKTTQPGMAKKAHALARTLTLSVLPDIGNQSSAAIKASTNEISDFLDSEINNGTDLDLIEVKKDKDGNLTTKPAVRTVADFYRGETLYFLSLNGPYSVEEGIQKFVFSNDDTIMITRQDGITVEGPYAVNFGPNKIDDATVLYMNSNTALLAEENWDLTFSTKSEYSNGSWPSVEASDVTADMFTNQTIYHVFDDSTTKSPKPFLTKMEFSANTVTLTESNGATSSAGWGLANGTVIIDGVFDGSDWHITPTAVSGDPQTLLNNNEVMFALSGRNAQGEAHKLAMFTYNKALAESIYLKWNNVVK
ncbi:hypothetical protein [Vibrio scophthalmi]|uniref:Lipoprotein n=1 Tax=Vibrio scophthalmi LMG 19158 TaxID=870967 RepID=F9RS98_9VIBR|nr:hypothetical protein [Vibrio scophthalmi]EGU32424.1 hypothetical protein VIS19158_06395 [Vibrio scophthalmi LMG 19158]